MKEKQHITINIADVAPISLDVLREREAATRQMATNVNLMWSQLAAQFPEKSSKDVLAMVAFRYAQVYYDLLEKVQAQESALANAEEAIDKILLAADI